MAGLGLASPMTGYGHHDGPAAYGDHDSLHVIWGEVESCRGSKEDSSSSRYSRTETSGRGSDGRERPRKLRNKPLLDRDIQFRAGASSSSRNNSGSDRSQEFPGSPGAASSNFPKAAGTTMSPTSSLKASREAPNQVVYAGANGRALEHQVVDQRIPHVASHALAQQGDDAAGVDSDSQDEGAQLQPQSQVQKIEAAVSPEELARITATVRRNDKGEPTSLGSAGHEENCRACLFVFTAAGCQNGVLCTFCHFKHKRANRPRPCKGKRNRFRKLAARVEQLQNPLLVELAATATAQPSGVNLPQKFAL